MYKRQPLALGLEQRTPHLRARIFQGEIPVSYTHLDVYKRQIVALATSLGIEQIAEGVETTQQRDRLKELGCTYAQGYLLSLIHI